MTNLKNNQDYISADDAISILRQGNDRFTNSLSVNRNLLQEVTDTEHGQAPFAAILSCMDSRAPVELIFDQGIGDIFSIRMAGNIISENVLGSLEYAVAVVGSTLIMVMGHTNCGAVKGACDDVKMGNLTVLLDKIKPAVEQESTISENRNGDNKDFVNKVATLNVYNSIQQMLEQSDIIREYAESGKIKIIPAMYHVASGKVEMLKEMVPA